MSVLVQPTISQARSIADSIIRDAPVRMTMGEWDKFRPYLIKKLEHTKFRDGGVLEIDSTWMTEENFRPDPVSEILAGKLFLHYKPENGYDYRVIRWDGDVIGGRWIVVRVATDEDIATLPRY